MMFYCRDTGLTEKMLDAAAIFQWYMEVSEKKYYEGDGKTHRRSLSSYTLHYMLADGELSLCVNLSHEFREELSDAYRKYFEEYPLTREEEAAEHLKYDDYLKKQINEFLRIAKTGQGIRQILELCDYEKRKFGEEKYAGAGRILGKDVDWSIFNFDFSKVCVTIESNVDKELNNKGWQRIFDIDPEADITELVQDKLGSCVEKAGCEVMMLDDYINAKVYLYSLSEGKILRVGDAEHVNNLWIELKGGKRL